MNGKGSLSPSWLCRILATTWQNTKQNRVLECEDDNSEANDPKAEKPEKENDHDWEQGKQTKDEDWDQLRHEQKQSQSEKG